MSNERPRKRTAWNRLHHRRFHLDETQRIQIGAQMLHYSRAGLEHAARVFIDDQIHIPSPVAEFLVR